MFGYVIANTEKLSPADEARYKACYCGLCHELGAQHGKLSRIFLNYDLVFLILVRGACGESGEIDDPSGGAANMAETLGQERCIAHPQKPHYYWVSQETKYAADMSVLLSYYQVEDDWQDDRRVIALGQKKLLEKAFEKTEKAYPIIGEKMKQGLAELAAIERSGRLAPDAAAGAFGKVMAAIFAGPEQNAALGSLGMALGKWIYIMDACLDRRDDLKRQRYNPLTAVPERNFETILNCLMADCVKAYEALGTEKDRAIIENILYGGVWTRFEAWRREKHEGSV